MIKSHSGRESRVRFAAVALAAADGAVGDAGLPAVIAEAYAAVVGGCFRLFLVKWFYAVYPFRFNHTVALKICVLICPLLEDKVEGSFYWINKIP